MGGAGTLPLPANTGRIWAAVPAVSERGFLTPGPFSEDEKYSRIKAGVAVGASGRSHLPAVRAVTGSFRCIKSGVKNSRRGSRLRSRFQRGYCRNEKTGVTRVSSATRGTLFGLDAPPQKLRRLNKEREGCHGTGKYGGVNNENPLQKM